MNAGGRNLTLLQLSPNGGTITNLGEGTVDTLTMSGGTLNATAVSLSGASSWSGGTINTNLTVLAAASLDFPSGEVTLGPEFVLTNQGGVSMTGGRLRGYNSCAVENHGTWTLSGANSSPFNHFYGGNVFNNHGILQKTGGADPADLDRSWTYNLPGETRCDVGELRFVSPVNLPDGAHLTGAGTIRSVGTTTLDGEVTESVGALLHDGGTLVCNPGAAVRGELEWRSGWISGNLTVPAGSALRVAGAGLRGLAADARIDNHGSLVFEASSPIVGWQNAAIQNHATGLFQCVVDGELFDNFYGGNQFTNDGLFHKSGGPGEALWTDWTIIHNNTVRVDVGAVVCQSVVHLAGGSMITGVGEFRLAGDVRLEGAVIETIGSLRQTGGTLTCSESSSFIGRFDWEGGNIRGHLTVPSSSSLEVHGAAFKRLETAAVLDIAGTYRWSGPSGVQGFQDCRINILPGGLCDLASDGDPFNQFYGGNELVNHGTLRKSGGAGGVTVCNDWTYRQHGNVECDLATLQFTSSLGFEGDSLVSGAGAVVISGSTSLSGAVEFAAPSTWAGGTWTGAGGTMTGNLVWSGGSSAGIWTVEAGGQLEIVDGSGAAKRVNTDAEVHIGGEMRITSGSLQGWDATARLRVLDGGRMRIAGGARLDDFYSGPTIEVQAGGVLDSTAAADATVDWRLDNHGTVSVPGGLLTFRAGGASSGLFEATGTGELRFGGGTQSLATGAEIRGPGAVTVAGGILEALAAVEGFVDVVGGTVRGTLPDGDFQFKDGSQWHTGYLDGRCRVLVDSTFTVHNVAGLRRVNTAGHLTVDGRMRMLRAGSVQCWQDVVFTIASGRILELAGDGQAFVNYFSNNRLDNHGTILRSTSAEDAVLSQIRYSNAGEILVETGRLLSTSSLDLLDGGRIRGAGRMVVTGGTTTLIGRTTVENSTFELAGGTLASAVEDGGTLAGSTIEWSAGNLSGTVTLDGRATTTGDGFRRLNGGAELRNAGVLTLGGSNQIQSWQNSTLRNLPGATLHATGQVLLSQYFSTGNQLVNEGIMKIGSSPGRQVVNYAFVQTASGRLEIGVAGPNPSTPEFDILRINGTATLAGTLAASLEGGYNPSPGTTFEVLTSNSRNGTFQALDALRFNATYPVAGNPPQSLHNVVLVAKDTAALDYEAWAASHGLTGVDALPGADPDGDLTDNFTEYALNMNPAAADVPPLTAAVKVLDGGRWLVLHYRRWDDRVAAGVVYSGQVSTDLAGWPAAGVIDEADLEAPFVAGSEARRCRVAIQPGRKFLRLHLMRQ